MMWLQENWIVALVVAVAAVAILWWLFARRKPDTFDDVAAPVAEPARPAKPLEPVKPDIVAAEPARFKAPEPAPTPPPAAAPKPAPAAESAAPEPAAPPEPAPIPAPAPAATDAAADNLQLLKGVGPKLATLLNSLGITRFDQIAGWTDADIAEIDPQLGTFQGRITRDNWVDQAGFLARRDKAGFEAKYGALGGEL
ncbi:MAG: hypothetical protein U0S50_08165 [Sphingopyxis sp.]|uniref:hypothetical protein n=1 Tax=Sphingopyxis sp. TaxID=1908224 RepID=UPI002ABA780A|nr:hypothetical protein [Sphingopyxis sp.]MDZ3831775.1 hypothetical protein [Sphingopyxis sp.]